MAKRLALFAFAGALAVALGVAGALASDTSEILGIVGLTPVTESTAIAVWVDVPAGQSVEGVRWYSNDGTVAYPGIRAVAGEACAPELMESAVDVSSAFMGETSSWCVREFNQPVASSSGGIWLIFRLPVGSSYLHEGDGGGAGLGVLAGDGTRRCWLTGDGAEWHPVSPLRRLAVEPIVAAEKRGDVLVLDDPTPAGFMVSKPETAPEATRSFSVAAVPNPFNPQVTIRFDQTAAGEALVEVFDVRGRHIATLLDEDLDIGEHAVDWHGRDAAGRSVASGVYLVHVQAGLDSAIQRVTLLR